MLDAQTMMYSYGCDELCTSSQGADYLCEQRHKPINLCVNVPPPGLEPRDRRRPDLVSRENVMALRAQAKADGDCKLHLIATLALYTAESHYCGKGPLSKHDNGEDLRNIEQNMTRDEAWRHCKRRVLWWRPNVDPQALS